MSHYNVQKESLKGKQLLMPSFYEMYLPGDVYNKNCMVGQGSSAPVKINEVDPMLENEFSTTPFEEKETEKAE